MSVRSRDGGRVLVALLLGVLLGIMAAELARRLEPRVALTPGHPAAPREATGPVAGAKPEVITDPVADVTQVEPVAAGNEPDSLMAEDRDSLPGDGTPEAPDGYPVKGNARSGIYHVPGGFAYDRTIASIYFRTPEAAGRAGFRAAKV